MTGPEHVRFLQAFNKLAVAVRLPSDQVDGSMQRVYWEGLVGFPIDAVEQAAKDLSTGQWFPKLGEWVTAAEHAKNAALIVKGLPSPREETWHFDCDLCGDSGWEELTCAGDTKQCGRGKAHAPHSYVRICFCRETNRTYLRRRAEERERNAGKTEAAKQQQRRGGLHA